MSFARAMNSGIRSGLPISRSMFSAASGGSTAALAALAGWLRDRGWPLVDAQVESPHLLFLGAARMPRERFLEAIAPLVEAPVRNPSLTINGVQLRFPVEIPCGASLEFQGTDTCVLYGKKGEELARVTPEGGPLVLEPGDNRIVFACDANTEAPARARVTVMSVGDHVEAQ